MKKIQKRAPGTGTLDNNPPECALHSREWRAARPNKMKEEIQKEAVELQKASDKAANTKEKVTQKPDRTPHPTHHQRTCIKQMRPPTTERAGRHVHARGTNMYYLR